MIDSVLQIPIIRGFGACTIESLVRRIGVLAPNFFVPEIGHIWHKRLIFPDMSMAETKG
jgi:hypothetical protein